MRGTSKRKKQPKTNGRVRTRTTRTRTRARKTAAPAASKEKFSVLDVNTAFSAALIKRSLGLLLKQDAVPDADRIEASKLLSRIDGRLQRVSG